MLLAATIAPLPILFLRGLLIGLVAGIPAGPVGALAARRVLIAGPVPGIMYGLGCALADLLYALAAGLGLNLAAGFLAVHASWLQLCGGIVVIVIGIVLVLNSKHTPRTVKPGRAGPLITAFVIAITNPAGFFAFSTMFSVFDNTGFTGGPWALLVSACGVFTGSFAWWPPFSYSIHLAGKRSRAILNTVLVNRIAGIVLCLLGIVLLARLFLGKG